VGFSMTGFPTVMRAFSGQAPIPKTPILEAGMTAAANASSE